MQRCHDACTYLGITFGAPPTGDLRWKPPQPAAAWTTPRPHHFDEATCVGLTKKVAAALAPGGRIAINDFVYDESLANPMAAMFRTTMLMWTRKGTTYTEADYRRWLGDAGLGSIQIVPSAGMPSTRVIGEKS